MLRPIKVTIGRQWWLFFDYHVNTNGWQDIGYNWLIDPLGNLYKGRGGGEDVRGAHMCGYNNNTMGICVIGTFTSVMPAQEALATLEQLLSYKACQKSFDVQGRADIVSHPGNMFRISGHRDGCSKLYRMPRHTTACFSSHYAGRLFILYSGFLQHRRHRGQCG
ncbi:MAG: N-acetylmuramoyl-L-alanine amidase [Saprospiraceae bacterium]|nr:N-acetylmuramoyl-L-alanine amidase [Saprospiraceae bacterium]